MLEYSEESRRLVSTFLRYRNEIDIYTEDDEREKEFYSVLLSRLVDSRIKISDITPLGARRNVINRCKNEPDNGRKKIFIIDGDVSMIHGSDIPVYNNLFILNAYCIENFLIDRDSAIDYAYKKCTTKSREYIEEYLGFETWYSVYSERFITLFIHFAILNLLGELFDLMHPGRFVRRNDDGTYTFLEDEFVKVLDSIRARIFGRMSEADYLEKLTELQNKWQISIQNMMTIVSGKDYLIPMLLWRIKNLKRSGSVPTVSEAKFHLVHCCDLSRLSDLKNAIEALWSEN